MPALVIFSHLIGRGACHEIRKNTNIKGIYVNGVEVKLSQCASDITLILDGLRESLLSFLAMLDDFSSLWPQTQ